MINAINLDLESKVEGKFKGSSEVYFLHFSPVTIVLTSLDLVKIIFISKCIYL